MNILINANTVFGLDRNGIKEDNIVELLPYLYCILTSNGLYEDPTADSEEGISWWDKFKDVIIQALAAAILVTSFVLSVIPPTSSFGLGLMYATFTGGLISGIISGTASSIMANKQGNRQMAAFADSFVNGFTHGVITSAIFYSLISIYKGLVSLPNNPAPRSMSNEQARKWYVKNVKKIGKRIDKTLPIEQQARQASALRNKYRTIAREAMYDQSSARKLDLFKPSHTFDELVVKYSARGYKGDAIFEEIIRASMRTNKMVDNYFGVML